MYTKYRMNKNWISMTPLQSSSKVRHSLPNLDLIIIVPLHLHNGIALIHGTGQLN